MKKMCKWLKELSSHEEFVPFLCMKLLEAWQNSSVSISQYIVLLRRITKGRPNENRSILNVCFI